MVEWKKIASNASKMHEDQGYSFVDKNNNNSIRLESPLVNTIPEDRVLKVEGKTIAPKVIRSFAWENRKQRFLERDTAFVWTYYDASADVSYLGAGAEVNEKVLSRVLPENVIRGYEKDIIDVDV